SMPAEADAQQIIFLGQAHRQAELPLDIGLERLELHVGRSIVEQEDMRFGETSRDERATQRVLVFTGVAQVVQIGIIIYANENGPPLRLPLGCGDRRWRDGKKGETEGEEQRRMTHDLTPRYASFSD